jgi:O-antigen ligase
MLYLIIIAIFSPSVWITNQVNVNLFDFIPIFIIIEIIIKKRNIYFFQKEEQQIIIIFLSFSIILFMSTFISFIYFEGRTINTFLQLYRMLISFIFLPFYIFSLRHIEIKKVIFIVSLVALFSGIVGESVNFISSIREFMFYKIVSNNQIFIPGFWRNMGFTAEGSYFADLIVITIFLNIFYNTKWKKFFLISLFLILISTFSKSVLLSFLVTIILYLIYIKKAMRLFLYIFLCFIFIIVFIWYFNLFDIIHLYFTSRAESSFSERSNGIWIIVVNFISNHNISFISGLGFKGLKYYANVAGAHNQYLSLFANFGIFSLVYLFIFFIYIPYTIFKRTGSKMFIFLVILLMIQCIVHEPLSHAKVSALYLFIFYILYKNSILMGEKNEKSINP